MITANALNIADPDTEWGCSERLDRTPPPPPPQVPKPYCVLLLRGCQTRYYSSQEELEQAKQVFARRKQTYMAFEYREGFYAVVEISQPMSE